MKKIMIILLVCFFAVAFSACEKEDPDNVGKISINVGIFEFEIPDYYDAEPVKNTPNNIIYMRPKEKDNCQLSFVVVPYDDAYTRSNEMSMMNTYLETFALDNVETWGKDELSFTGEKDGVKVAGVIDTVFCSSHEEAVSVDESQMVLVSVIYNEDKVSPYYYGDDFNDIIFSATVDGYEGVFNMTSDELNDYDPEPDTNTNTGGDSWDTDNNGEADWHDVDTNNDGDVSQDEMDQYLDDWEKEENESDGGGFGGSGTWGQ